MTEESMRKIDQIMNESDILEDDAQVEFKEDGFHVIFGAISDWYNKSITLAYKGDCTPAEKWCLLYELALWCVTPREKRHPLSAVLKQYTGHLPEPKINIRTHIIG